METLKIKACEAQPGDIALGMIVTDIRDKRDRIELLGSAVTTRARRVGAPRARIVDRNLAITVDRPRFAYQPKSRF